MNHVARGGAAGEVFAEGGVRGLHFHPRCGGFIRVFVEVGEKLIPLLRVAARRGVLPVYTRRILAVLMERVEIVEYDLASMIEPLSERELEVLRLVTAGMSNRVIAKKFYISTGALKSHVHNLCGKLGVLKRIEAVMRAKELRLI